MGIKVCVCSCILFSDTMSFGFNAVRQQPSNVPILLNSSEEKYY
jgi:hypothetical protein